jgi:hypothetical protein
MAFPKGATGGYDTKSATCRTLEVTCLGFRRSNVALLGAERCPLEPALFGRLSYRREPLPFGIRREPAMM